MSGSYCVLLLFIAQKKIHMWVLCWLVTRVWLGKKHSGPLDEVFNLLKAQDPISCRGSRHLQFLGNPLCNKGFMKLLGVGKFRFKTLNGAARRGEEHCPYDSRYMVKGKRVPSEKWEQIHGFLMKLYLEVGEAIPDGLNSNKRPRHGNKRLDAPNLDRREMRHLPHGSINDYWHQCQAALPDLVVSRKLFCSEPLLSFWIYVLLLFCCC